MLTSVLLFIFLIHLVAFSALWLKRRQHYYLALILTFSLLSAAMAAELFAPTVMAAQGVALYQALRTLAWGAAVVSVGWTVHRILNRARRDGQA